MAKFISEAVTFQTADIASLPAKCTTCGLNPPTLKYGNSEASCLPCEYRRLAGMAQRGIDQSLTVTLP